MNATFAALKIRFCNWYHCIPRENTFKMVYYMMGNMPKIRTTQVVLENNILWWFFSGAGAPQARKTVERKAKFRSAPLPAPVSVEPWLPLLFNKREWEPTGWVDLHNIALGLWHAKGLTRSWTLSFYDYPIQIPVGRLSDTFPQYEPVPKGAKMIGCDTHTIIFQCNSQSGCSIGTFVAYRVDLCFDNDKC
jgi:hypothetical protein